MQTVFCYGAIEIRGMYFLLDIKLLKWEVYFNSKHWRVMLNLSISDSTTETSNPIKTYSPITITYMCCQHIIAARLGFIYKYTHYKSSSISSNKH